MSDAGKIIKLLVEKHAKDVFVSECKDGSSWGGHLRMDGWAMSRSWAHPCMYGYEIKISRADFLGDDKWPGYLSLCNRFSFVAPRGIIQPGELSEGVGLLEVSFTGNTLRTVRKSSYREIEPPIDLIRYILMCRAKICGSQFGRMLDDEDNARFWRKWLEQKQDLQDIGYRVSRRLRQVIAEQIDAVEIENRKLKSQNDGYAEIAALLKDLNLSPSWYHTSDRLRDIAAEFKAKVPEAARCAIVRAKVAIDELMSQIGNE